MVLTCHGVDRRWWWSMPPYRVGEACGWGVYSKSFVFPQDWPHISNLVAYTWFATCMTTTTWERNRILGWTGVRSQHWSMGESRARSKEQPDCSQEDDPWRGNMTLSCCYPMCSLLPWRSCTRGGRGEWVPFWRPQENREDQLAASHLKDRLNWEKLQGCP